MNIVFLDAKTLGEDISLKNFEKFGDVVVYKTTSKEQTLNRVKEADIVITNKVVLDKEIMENSNIKLICITATGTNNIDMEYAKEKGIEVKNVAGYSTSSVVQLTFTFVFFFLQNLKYYKRYVESHKWEESDIFTHIDKPFHQLGGLKWGIIGLGTIGGKVAQIASAFDCDVSYYSTSGKNTNTNYNSKDLETLLKESDIISIHAPLNDNTYNLLNKSNLNLLKDDAILINVGRGGIINEQDLADLINSGKQIRCGIDVLENEPIKADCPLNNVADRQNLVITPHIAWASIESRNKLMELVYNNINNFIK